ncbi:MAG: tetratricopeptide repeat protein [Mesorhizobium sp.]|nr:tetratricopeptide repeat protein [Mesorhizobium sp.]
MRSVFHCLTGIALLSAGAALAAEPMVAAAPPATTADALAPLDKLFSDLKRERNAKSAERLASRIWQEWFKSGSASIDLMMQWSDTAMKAEKYGVALDFLDRVTVLQPDFAEGWNRRATVHFQMKNYEKSMADIERTLRLEPRHFGALSGMAQILKASGRQEMALKAYQRVLDVYPMMRNAQNEVAALSEELAGEGI